MKIVLINPPVTNLILGNLPESLTKEKEDPMPPLGLMYVASYLEKYTSHQVKIIDCLIDKLDYKQLKIILKEEKPDLVGITALTFNLIDVLQTAKIVKEIDSNINIVLGGAHVNIYPKETISFPEVDFLVLGEGEKPMKDLVDNINQIKNLYNIKGIVFKDRNKIINTGPRNLIQDLDSLPFPARELIPYKKYVSALSKVGPVTTMFTSRGCPYRCLFCNRAHLGKIFRARSAKNVVDEMEECQKMGIKEIFIYDDTFTVDRQRVLDICEEIKNRNLKINWDIRARVDTVDEETLKQMKATGCQRIHYGVEAGTQKILNVLRKGITLEQVEKAFQLTKKIGIHALAFFMLGSPQETRKDILQTIKFAKKLEPDFVVFSVTTPYPSTDLYSLGLKEGTLSHDCWQKFAQSPKIDFVPPVWEKELSREELFSLSKKAYRSFYRRPAYIVKSFFQLFQLRSFKELMTKIKAAFNILKV